MDAALRLEIQNELMTIGASAPVLITRGVTSKLYEIFVLTCVIKALQGLNARFLPKNSVDRRTATLDFRLGPGTILTPASRSSFIHVILGNKEYEIQNGLRVAGTSKVLHELDVCIIERSDAVRCRTNRIDPTNRMIKFLAECKFYGSNLDLSLGREFLGLSTEFSGKKVRTIVSNVNSGEVHGVITYHNGTENFDLSPLFPSNVDRFVKWLENEFRNILM